MLVDALRAPSICLTIKRWVRSWSITTWRTKSATALFSMLSRSAWPPLNVLYSSSVGRSRAETDFSDSCAPDSSYTRTIPLTCARNPAQRFSVEKLRISPVSTSGVLTALPFWYSRSSTSTVVTPRSLKAVPKSRTRALGHGVGLIIFAKRIP